VPGEAGFSYFVEYFGRPSYRTYINREEGAEMGLSGYLDGEKYVQKLHEKYHISIWVQKSRIRLYQNEIKAVDLPKAFNLPGIKFDRIRFENGSLYVSNIRVAVGAPDTRNKLLTEGKLVTYGIYFDSGKDVVKPESYGTLKDIAAILTENPDVNVKIIGYTDADGNDAANLDLSKRRAAAVKNELVKNFGIDAARIETDGMGEANPVAPNDTPSNKALNRRVEFIKL
jgi:outer membrane protein OmpA-like peptidoglycan-associated protein